MKKKIIMLLMVMIGFLLVFSKPISHYVIGLRSNDYQVSKVSQSTIAKMKQQKPLMTFQVFNLFP